MGYGGGGADIGIRRRRGRHQDMEEVGQSSGYGGGMVILIIWAGHIYGHEGQKLDRRDGVKHSPKQLTYASCLNCHGFLLPKADRGEF